MREILLQYKSTTGVHSCNKQSIYPGVSVSQRTETYSCTFTFTQVGVYVLVCNCLERRHCFIKVSIGFSWNLWFTTPFLKFMSLLQKLKSHILSISKTTRQNRHLWTKANRDIGLLLRSPISSHFSSFYLFEFPVLGLSLLEIGIWSCIHKIPKTQLDGSRMNRPRVQWNLNFNGSIISGGALALTSVPSAFLTSVCWMHAKMLPKLSSKIVEKSCKAFPNWLCCLCLPSWAMQYHYDIGPRCLGGWWGSQKPTLSLR